MDKCKVMHIVFHNRKMKYETEDKMLEAVAEERDLGAIKESDLEWNKQCTKSGKAAMKFLGMMKRSFSYMSRNMTLQLYKTTVRPCLDISF
jgi:hypothetical protein